MADHIQRSSDQNVPYQESYVPLTPVLCWFSPPLVPISKYPFDHRSSTAAALSGYQNKREQDT